MPGKKAKNGNFMKQKGPCILTCNLNTNLVKNVIFVRKSSKDVVLTNFEWRIHWSPKTDAVTVSQKLPFFHSLIQVPWEVMFEL